MRYVWPLTTLAFMLLAFRTAAAEPTQPPFSTRLSEPDSSATSDFITDAVDCGDEINLGDLTESHGATGRWSVLTELTTLFPSYSTATLATANEHPVLGPRVSVGWESDRGFGIRGRMWGFEGDNKIEQSPTPSTQTYFPIIDYSPSYYAAQPQVVSHQINFSGSRFDLDFTKRVRHSTGNFAFGASVTAAHLTLREQYTTVQSTQSGLYDNQLYAPDGIADDIDGDGLLDVHGYDLESPARTPDQTLVGLSLPHYVTLPSNSQSLASTNNASANRTVTTTYQGGQLVRNRGAGLGLLAEGTHRFYETPYHIWSVFGRGRIAYLIGRWDEPYSNTLAEGDGNMAIGEAALGIEYRRPFRYADLSMQCAFEVQSWDVSIAERINLAGVTTGAGLSW